MSALRELLARVASNPDDVEARLAYADALPKKDAHRAELIRAQVTLAGWGLDPARRLALTQRVRTLLGAHDEAWADRLRALGATAFRFTRGFVGEMTLSEEALAEHGQTLLALEPVSRLRIEARDGQGLASAVARPWFAQVRSLTLSGRGASAAARALASSPHVGALGSLGLASVKRDGVEALAKSESLPGLRSLSLTGNGSLGDEVSGLLASTRLGLLRLYLSDTELSDEGAALLARAKTLQGLEVLALNRDALSDEGAEALAASKTLVNVQRLELERTEVSEQGALAFRSAKALPRLRILSLRGLGLSTAELAPVRKRLGNGLKL